MAETNSRDAWGTYDDAVDAVHRFGLTGVGFVFAESDPFSGVDIDDCRDPLSGAIDGWALEILDQLNSYAEVSPSGTGVRLWLQGCLPKGEGNQIKVGQGKVEMFSHGRYFTVTGQHVVDMPKQIENRQSELSA